MNLPIVCFFHDYGLIDSCLTTSCQKFHDVYHTAYLNSNGKRTVLRHQANYLKVISCFPILGQVIGILGIMYAAVSFPKFKTNVCKIMLISLVVREVLTFLGLGIILLLLDIIITIATLIKEKLACLCKVAY